MKSTIKIKSLILLLGIGTFLSVFNSSCKKDDPAPAATPNVVQKAQADTNFTILVAAVIKTGLTDALSTTQNITVFAPLNSAFRALGYSVASINALTSPADIAGLKSVLQYHVLASKIPASAINSTNIEQTTLNTAKLYATRNASGVFINGVKVEIADVSASNGVIHAIGKVLLPPAGNLKAVAAANANFSYLVAAVVKADSTDNAISNALTGAGPLTVFAPTNAAFIAAGFPTAASVSAAPSYVLRKILLYHVIGARVFSSDLTNNSTPATVQGQNVTITLSPAKVKGAANPTAANITPTDIMATNGVIHVIDQVLLPQ